MAKLIKFPLGMADGTKVRTIEELREHADVASIASYYEDGKLYRWLMANYQESKAKDVLAVEEFVKAETDRISTQKIQKLYDVLGLGNVDKSQLSEYLEKGSCVNHPEKTCDFEVEDDAALKAEVGKFMKTGVNIDTWNIASDDAEEDDLCLVQIEQKDTGAYLCFKLKNNSLFYKSKWIADVIMTLDSAPFKNLMLKGGSTASMKEIKNTPKGSTIQFGMYKWFVAEIQDDKALLVCSEIVSTRIDGGCYKSYHDSDLRNWLNTDFLKSSFSREEISMIRKNSDGDKISLPSEEFISNLPPYALKELYENCFAIKSFLPGATLCIVTSKGNLNPNFSQSPHGVAPAIIVSLQD